VSRPSLDHRGSALDLGSCRFSFKKTTTAFRVCGYATGLFDKEARASALACALLLLLFSCFKEKMF
jgi:hypothetical protein